MSAMLLAQQILNGLLDGVYYLLIALGLSLIFRSAASSISRMARSMRSAPISLWCFALYRLRRVIRAAPVAVACLAW